MTPDFRSYKKLWEYAVLSLGKDKASAVEHLTLTEFTFLLRMHQLVTRLYHRSPDACIGMAILGRCCPIRLRKRSRST